MSQDRAPITAVEAAQIAQRAQQLQAERVRDVIQPALEHAYAEIRCAASSDAGLTAVDVYFNDFGLTAEQQLALSRALERQGFKVQSHPHLDKFTLGWQPVSTPRASIDPGFGLATFPSPAQRLLREGPQEVGLNE